MTAEKKPTFEEALIRLEQTSENLKQDNITLEDAIKNFEDGIGYYKQCRDILDQAKQKIETYSK